ncbi:MAG: permease prefix domain 2-containing transporter [Cyclobacteriaceae bacterium]|nr:permease prefix domain 2-containing transporter [Cyclobacteriaceae bacterium]
MSKAGQSWAIGLLRSFCPPHLLEEVEGDLIQKYNRDVKVFGERRAKWKLVWNVIRFFRPGIILRNKFSTEHNQLPMFKNYFITSLRHIRKSKTNFAFKLGGLSLAIFSFLAIAIYVAFQLSFDTYHIDHQNIYRVNSQRKDNGVVENYAIAPRALGPILQMNVPEVISMARVGYVNHNYLRLDKNLYDCEGLLEADTSLFSVLTFQFIKGNTNALHKPNSIALTRTMANKLFGTTDVLQRTLGINNDPNLYEVTAVIEDTPANSHLFASAIVSIRDKYEFSLTSVADPVAFVDYASTLFVRLSQPPNGGFLKKVETALEPYINKSDRAEYGFGISFQPIANIYLGPAYRNDYFGKGSPVYVYAFSVLGILLLIVAGINYVNLSIADFSSRSRETGVRKVLGARRHQLVTQVTIESLLFAIISLCVGIGLLYLLFPKILELLDADLRFEMLLEPHVLVIGFAGIVSLLFFSTYFPARQVANTGVIQNLKSKSGGYNSSVSQILLFGQFTISAICLCFTFMVSQQIGFIHNKELGFDRKNLLVLSLPQDLFTVKKMQTFKQEIKQIPGVTNVSNSSFRIGGGYWKDWYFVEQEDKQEMKHVELYEVFSDDELFSTLGIKLLDGRIFNANIPSDSGAAFIVNESAVRELGWKNPLGKRIYTHPEEKGKWDGTIVGIVPDINISPLYDKVRPLVMRLPWTNEYPDGFIYVRHQGDEKAIVKSLEEKYKAIMPGYPLFCRAVDELYNSRHQKESKAFASLQFGTLVIILVSMLGIFSMAAYISIKRMKEFGIRKVLGASVTQIFSLHMNYFVRLMLFSNLIALPIAYWLIQKWLETFAYRIELSYWPFLFVGLASLLLVIISGSFSAWKSGRMNPIDVIKME